MIIDVVGDGRMMTTCRTSFENVAVSPADDSSGASSAAAASLARGGRFAGVSSGRGSVPCCHGEVLPEDGNGVNVKKASI